MIKMDNLSYVILKPEVFRRKGPISLLDKAYRKQKLQVCLTLSKQHLILQPPFPQYLSICTKANPLARVKTDVTCNFLFNGSNHYVEVIKDAMRV
jgi:hypothetical protein